MAVAAASLVKPRKPGSAFLHTLGVGFGARRNTCFNREDILEGQISFLCRLSCLPFFLKLFPFFFFTYEDVLVWVKEKVVLDDDDVRGYVMRMQHFLISVNSVATLLSCSALFSSRYFDQPYA